MRARIDQLCALSSEQNENHHESSKIIQKYTHTHQNQTLQDEDPGGISVILQR